MSDLFADPRGWWVLVVGSAAWQVVRSTDLRRSRDQWKRLVQLALLAVVAAKLETVLSDKVLLPLLRKVFGDGNETRRQKLERLDKEALKRLRTVDNGDAAVEDETKPIKA